MRTTITRTRALNNLVNIVEPVQDDHTLNWGLTQCQLLARGDGTPQSTIDWMRASVRHLINSAGDVPLLGITPREMAELKIALGQAQCWDGHPTVKKTKPKGLSPASVNGYLRGVKAFYHRLTVESLIPYNPVKEYRVRKAPETIPPTLSAEQIKQVLSQPDKSKPEQLRDWAFMCVLYDSKCRVSELCKLTMSNLSLEDHRFTVVGKGGRMFVYYFWEDATRAFLSYLARRPKPVRVDNVFLTYDGRPLNRRRMLAIIKRYGKKAGVRVSPHTFRHSGALSHLHQGGDLATLQLMLNHRDIKSTMIYARLGNEDAARAQAMFSTLDSLGIVPRGKVQRQDRRLTEIVESIVRR